MQTKPPYIQMICPKHGPTTFLHADREKDDFCLLKGTPIVEGKPEKQKK